MATDLKSKMLGMYDEIWEFRDRRVDGWFLMSSPMPTIALCVIYVYLVKVWGPNFMKNREPINCQTFMLIYNAFQVLLSMYIVAHGVLGGWVTEFSFFCQPIDYTEKGNYMVLYAWVVHLSKYLDLIETFCFLARKKFNQVSVLHVYHHFIMPINVWFVLRFLPGGHGTFAGFVNSIVHVIMYTYYLIAGLGPQYQKYLWWKSYVTKIQLAQFIIVMLHSVQLFVRNDCNYPMYSAYFNIANSTIFFALFAHFYINAYLLAKKKNGLKTKPTQRSNVAANEGNNNKIVAENGSKKLD